VNEHLQSGVALTSEDAYNKCDVCLDSGSQQATAEGLPPKPSYTQLEHDLKVWKNFAYQTRASFEAIKLGNKLGLITDKQAFDTLRIVADRIRSVINEAVGESQMQETLKNMSLLLTAIAEDNV
jgi:hypothetical protein